jgi:3,4-dihydroxy 2-butanone 4-phosphate synthase/GTP cyclohydrolase II
MASTAKPSPEAGSRESSGPTPEALAALAAGRMVVVSDGERGEGDLVLAAQFGTPDAVNFMNRTAGGWVCLALTARRCDELGLAPQATGVPALMATIDAREGISNGISAHDQAHTIQVAIDPSTGPGDLVTPGRVQPLRAEPGGVLARAGHVEAAVDLARLAGLRDAAVVCEVQNEDGSMAGPDDLAAFCRQHGLPMVWIGDLIAHRHRFDQLVEQLVEIDLPTRHGTWRAIAYRAQPHDDLHMALVKGDVGGASDVLVRVHTGCLTGDVFHSSLCDCGALLEAALERIDSEGRGVVVYLDPQPRGPGVFAELAGDAPHHRARAGAGGSAGERSPETLRTHGIGAQILRDLGLTSIRVLTNNPKRIVGLDGFGLTVTAQTPLNSPRRATPHSR